jgi:hypothetical protein
MIMVIGVRGVRLCYCVLKVEFFLSLLEYFFYGG